MFFSKAVVLGLAALAAAHPGHEDSEYRQAVAARANTRATRRALEGCASQLQSRGVVGRGIERRRTTVEKQRQARDISIDGEFILQPLRNSTSSQLTTWIL